MLLDCVQNDKPITWLADGESHRTITGVARAVCKDKTGAAFLSNEDDVRDGYLWLSGNLEHFLPVRECLHMIREGEMALNYRMD
jgi:hypothetical protein